MILSASRRTDIPNYYMDWFLHRIREGYVDVRNPMTPHQISRIALSPSVVDCIVFWTKNPENMLPHLGELAAYPYYIDQLWPGYRTQSARQKGPPDPHLSGPLFQNRQRAGRLAVRSDLSQPAVHRFLPFGRLFGNCQASAWVYGKGGHQLDRSLCKNKTQYGRAFPVSAGGGYTVLYDRTDGPNRPRERHDDRELCGVLRPTGGGCPTRKLHRPSPDRADHRLSPPRRQRPQPTRSVRVCREHRHRRLSHLPERMQLLLRQFQPGKSRRHRPALCGTCAPFVRNGWATGSNYGTACPFPQRHAAPFGVGGHLLRNRDFLLAGARHERQPMPLFKAPAHTSMQETHYPKLDKSRWIVYSRPVNGTGELIHRLRGSCELRPIT